MRAVGGAEVGGNGIGPTAGRPDFGDDRLGFARAAPVMDEDLGALPGERDGDGAPDAARRAGDEGGLA